MNKYCTSDSVTEPQTKNLNGKNTKGRNIANSLSDCR